MSFPQDRWYVRLVFKLENLLRQLSGDRFRTVVHCPSAMAAVRQEVGWRRVGHRSTMAWSVERWGRPE